MNSIPKTHDEIVSYYTKQKKLQVEVLNQDELVCVYKTKTLTKAVFLTDILDRETFKQQCIVSNRLGANKMIVYCNHAYYVSDISEIVIMRN